MNIRVSYGACTNCGSPILYQGAQFCSPQCNEAWAGPRCNGPFCDVPVAEEGGTCPACVEPPSRCQLCHETEVAAYGDTCDKCASHVRGTASHVLVLDTETVLTRPGCMAPPLACVSYATREGAAGLWHHTEARPWVEQALNSDLILVGHHLAYDMVVFCAKWPDLVPLIFEVYTADRVTDTMLREKLIDIAHGTPAYKYSLEDVARRRLGVTMEKDLWRTRYGEFIDVPLSEWPEGAKQYAIGDSTTTLQVWEHQEQERHWLLDEYRQARAAFWLQLMSVWGIHTDEVGVRAFAQKTQQKYDDIARDLLAAGLLRVQGKKNPKLVRNTKVARERMEVSWAQRTDAQPARTKTGISLSADNCNRSHDPLLEKYAELSSITSVISTNLPLLQQGIHEPIHTKFDSLKTTGRTGSSSDDEGRGGNVQNLPTEVGVRECFVPRPGKVFAIGDYSAMELHSWAQVCLGLFGQSAMAEALNQGVDPHTKIAALILNISYEEAIEDYHQNPKGRVYMPRQSGKVCFHPETEVLTRRGWIRIPELSPHDQVCSARLADNGDVDLEWEVPIALTNRRFKGSLVHLKNEGIDLRVTPDHRMCGWRRTVLKKKKGVVDRVVTCLPREVPSLRFWPNAGALQEGKIELGGDEEEVERLLRIAVAVQADGSYAGSKIRLGFTKQRKIERLRGLLEEGEYDFKFVGAQKVSTFYLKPNLSEQIKKLLTPQKTLPWWWVELPYRLRESVLDEARYWDSHTFKNAGYGYCSVPEENVDVLQALATLTNVKTRKVHEGGAFKLSVKTKHRSRGGNLVPQHIPYEGVVYCLTTRNDTIVVRDGGVPVITRQCNFGFPGGAGFARFRDYARQSYGVDISPERAKELKDYWRAAWPESRLYADWMGAQDMHAPFQLEHAFVGRFRGGLGYTDGSNTLFQGLAADCAKNAGFLIAKACYADSSSVLYGSRPVLFVHDEFVLEVDDDQYAHERAIELARLMKEGADVYLPDVPSKVEPMLCRRWSKRAKPVWENGRLVPWNMEVS